jgi:hypothetical protein
VFQKSASYLLYAGFLIGLFFDWNIRLTCLLTFSGLHSIMIQKTDLLNTDPLKFHILQIKHN